MVSNAWLEDFPKENDKETITQTQYLLLKPERNNESLEELHFLQNCPEILPCIFVILNQRIKLEIQPAIIG
jgi:hypothetical protein